MKKFLFVLVFALLLPLKIIYAEEKLPQPDGQFMQRPQQNWEKVLKLDDTQKAQFEAIKAESRPQVQAIMQQIATLRQQLDNIRADDEKKLQAILNESQQAKFNKIKARSAKQHKRPQPREERRKRFKMGEI